MRVRCSASLAVVLAGFAVFAPFAYGQDEAEVDKVITEYLASQKTEQEDAQKQASAVGDLNGDGSPEMVLVWSLLGPTYSRDSLTVFSKTEGGYKPLATFPLAGEARLSSVKGGVIFINQKVLGKNDPRCCPSVKKLGKYRLAGKKIVEVRR